MGHDDVQTHEKDNQYGERPNQEVPSKPVKARKPRAHKDAHSSAEESHRRLPTTPETSAKVQAMDANTTKQPMVTTGAVIQTAEPLADSSVEVVETQQIPAGDAKQTNPTEEKLTDPEFTGACPSSENTVPDEVSDESDIPPIKQIRNLLVEFEMRVPVWGLTVFTVDGYILAHRLFYDGMPENIEMAVSSMSAGLITISQDFLRLVASSSSFRQVLIDADDETEDVSFSIMLKHIAENVMLTCIFPNSAKLGLVSFEIENLSNSINEIVGLWDVKLHEETVT